MIFSIVTNSQNSKQELNLLLFISKRLKMACTAEKTDDGEEQTIDVDEHLQNTV